MYRAIGDFKLINFLAGPSYYHSKKIHDHNFTAYREMNTSSQAIILKKRVGNVMQPVITSS
jgi:hypothetical protein